MMVRDCDQYRRESVSTAVSLFYSHWVQAFGDDEGRVGSALSDLVIDFSPGTKRGYGYSLIGVSMPVSDLGGLTLAPGWAWVRSTPGGRLCDSALVHELVHVAIWSVKGSDPDPDHEGLTFSGWTVGHTMLIDRVNLLLYELRI